MAKEPMIFFFFLSGHKTTPNKNYISEPPMELQFWLWISFGQSDVLLKYSEIK